MTAPRLDFGYLREPPSARVADRLLRCGKYLLFGFCMMLLAHRPGVWEWFPDYLEWALQLCLYSGAGLSAWLAYVAYTRNSMVEIALLQPLIGVTIALIILTTTGIQPEFLVAPLLAALLEEFDRLILLLVLKEKYPTILK